jgi:catechol 2,3-dioxygenase-like lactoylglutathione lyase family enzyme
VATVSATSVFSKIGLRTRATMRVMTTIPRGDTNAQGAAVMSAPRLNVIGVVVQDMGRSLAFYRRLGLDVPAEKDSEPHVDHELPGGLRVAWDTVETIRSFDPDYAPGPSTGMSLAFALETPAEVDSTYAELVSAGAEGHKEPWDAFWGQRYALVRDPDGNAVDLYSPL